MVNCAAPNCRANNGHLFPKDPLLRKKWLDFVQKTDINKYAVVCKAHFTEDDFLKNVVFDGLPTPRDRLKPNAVPTISVPPGPAYLSDETQPWNLPSQKRKHDSVVSPRNKYKYAKLQRSAEQVYQSQVRSLRVAILTDPQMIRLLDHIKKKFMDSAPSPERFPPHWTNPSLAKKKCRRIRDGFPPFSMPCLVTLAIESTHARFATKLQILAFISKNFPCYKLGDNVWQNLVSETIDMYKFFQKLSVKLSPNPSMTYYTFSPSKKMIISSEVYEAFTDPRFDNSKIDLQGLVQTDTDEDDVDDTEEHCRIIAMNEKRELPSTNERKESKLHDTDNLASNDADSSDVDSQAEEAQKPKIQPNSLSVWEILSCGEDEDDEELEEFAEEITVRGKEPESESSGTLFKCCFCSFTSSDTRVTAEHLLVKHLNGVVYCCQYCDYVASSSEMLETHKMARHSDSDEEI